MVEMGERGFGPLMVTRVWEIWAGAAGLVLRLCRCAEGWALEKRVSNERFERFYV